MYLYNAYMKYSFAKQISKHDIRLYFKILKGNKPLLCFYGIMREGGGGGGSLETVSHASYENTVAVLHHIFLIIPQYCIKLACHE